MTGGLLHIEGVSVSFPVRGRRDWPWTPARALKAVNDVSLSLSPGETLGIVGETGSGKSTLARAIVGTLPVSGGVLAWRGKDLATLSAEERQSHRRDIQMVFQDPVSALNPRMAIGDIIAEPLVTHAPSTPKADVRTKVQNAMQQVGLPPALINHHPREFTDGQCQRIGIARALILEPQLLICDEPVSALDVSVQGQIINLLAKLQRDLGLAMIFIAHDLSVVKQVSTRIAVMYLGRLMEVAPTHELIGTPGHPYTKALLSSVPIPDPQLEARRRPMMLDGDLPSPFAPPSGCVFRTRCPIARAECALPDNREIWTADDRMVACPFHEDGGA